MTAPIIQNNTIQQFTYDANVLQSILWQYQNAPNITALLQAKQDVWDTDFTDFWEDFYTNIFNLQTANDFGLAVWAIILGAPITYIVTAGGAASWGFGTNHVNFGNGNFLGVGGSNTTYTFSTDTARVILQLQYFRLIGTCTVPAINRMLQFIFAEDYGQAYVVDGLNMTQKYCFAFTPPSDMQLAFNSLDILPRPAGVSSSWSII